MRLETGDGVTELGERGGDGVEFGLGGGDGLGLELGELLLASIELGGANLALGLELGDEGVVAPADLGGEIAEAAELAARLEAQVAEGAGHNEALEFVIGVGDTVENLEVVEGSAAAAALVGHHAADSAPEDAGGGAVVVGTTAGVGVHALVQEEVELELVAEEGARDVDLLATNNDHFTAVESSLAM